MPEKGDTWQSILPQMCWTVLFTITARTQTLLLQVNLLKCMQFNPTQHIYICVYTCLAVQLAWSVKVATLWLCLHSQMLPNTLSFAYRSWRQSGKWEVPGATEGWQIKIRYLNLCALFIQCSINSTLLKTQVRIKKEQSDIYPNHFLITKDKIASFQGRNLGDTISRLSPLAPGQCAGRNWDTHSIASEVFPPNVHTMNLITSNWTNTNQGTSDKIIGLSPSNMLRSQKRKAEDHDH